MQLKTIWFWVANLPSGKGKGKGNRKEKNEKVQMGKHLNLKMNNKKYFNINRAQPLHEMSDL